MCGQEIQVGVVGPSCVCVRRSDRAAEHGDKECRQQYETMFFSALSSPELSKTNELSF